MGELRVLDEASVPFGAPVNGVLGLLQVVGGREQAPHDLVGHAQIGVLLIGALGIDLRLRDVVLLIVEMAQRAPGAGERGRQPDGRPEVPFRTL